MTEYDRHAVLDECFEHNDHLRTNGHIVAEIPLQPPETALTLYWKNGKVATTDGLCAETKEQLGGLTILDCFESRILQDPQSILDKNEGKLTLPQRSLCTLRHGLAPD